MESSPPIFHTLSFFLSFQVPWPSFIVALIVLFIARGAQHAQRDNWNVTKDNLGDYSYPKVSKGRDGERERRGKRGEGWAVGRFLQEKEVLLRTTAISTSFPSLFPASVWKWRHTTAAADVLYYRSR
jgi:hypothetical protein